MLKGSIYIANDKNMALSLLPNYKIIVFGEDGRDLLNIDQINIQPGSILMPPYQASMHMMTDINQFVNNYMQYLATNESVLMYIIAIMRSLYEGINILLYVSPEEYELPYSKVFIEYIKNTYGILIGTPTSQYLYDQNFNAINCNLLYMYEQMSVEEYFMNYPPQLDIPNEVIPKLIHEVNPFIQDTSFESYKRYFYQYKENIKNKGKFLFSPFKRKR